MFLAAVAAAAGSTEASPACWGAALGLLGCAAWCQPERLTPGVTPIALAVWAYALWVVATNMFVSPAYTAAAPFHAAFLAGGFTLGRGFDRATRQASCVALAGGAVVLALWSLWQIALGGEARGHAHFETPATLAAVLNLALVPLLAVLLWGAQRGLVIVLGVVLVAGLAAALSRGGFLALACGLLVALVFARHMRIHTDARRLATLGAVLALGWGCAALAPLSAALAPLIAQWLPAGSGEGAAPAAHDMIGTTAASAGERLELYALAGSALEGHFGIGVGYLGFNALLEAGRQAVPSYGRDGVTYFAHNDYLQTLVELGLPGLAALVAIVGLPFWLVWRKRREQASEPLALVAMLGALATMAVHATVDFPFYVPLCLLLFGLVLGAADRLLVPRDALAAGWHTPAARVAGLLIAAAIVLPLILPVAAEAAAGHAQRRWRAADAQAAAYWFEVARRLEPRDWRYHWYAGQFWLMQAAPNRNPTAARLADEAFAAGFAINPRQPQNLLGRVATQRRFGALLAEPADAGTLRAWMNRALELAPLNAGVRAEQARLQQHFSNTESK